MINFLTYADIDRLAGKLRGCHQILKKALTRDGKTVFPSHSFKNEKHLPLVIHILENLGGQIYVEVKNDKLPVVPSVETANVLRESLATC